MKPVLTPTPRANRFAGMFEPATVVLFAGCGGTCIGIEQAYVDGGYTDKYVDLAVNHWDTAVGVHELNHPMTEHLRGDVREIDPDSVLLGRHIAYLHASPDCTHFSKARGSKPKRKEIRGLAWVVIDWAKKRRPTVITLENVEEFRQWGPLGRDGQPCPRRKGQTFGRWVKALEGLGYVVESKELRACDYGAPTTRKRLFVVARCDAAKGRTIVWPEKTHGKPQGQIHCKGHEQRDGRNDSRLRTDLHSAGQGPPQPKCDRSVCEALGASGQRVGRGGRSQFQDGGSGVAASQSLVGENAGLKPFRTAAECIDWSIPMLSIFATPEEAKAFGKRHGVGTPRRPLQDKTLQRIARGLVKWVLNSPRPFIVNIENYGTWGDASRGVDQPLSTITAGPKGGKHAVVDATLAPYTVPNLGEREGQAPRSGSVEQPMPTVTSKGNGARLVAATLQTLNHAGPEHRAQSPAEPLHTITSARDARALVSALITKHYGGVVGHGVEQPIGTVTGTDHHAVTVAHLVNYHGEKGGESRSQSPDEPIRTLDTQNRFGLVAAFLDTYYGNSKDGTSPADPSPTVVSKDRISLVTVAIDGQTYVITDIAMRMLTPRELLAAQGFPRDYRVDVTADGKPVTKADQVKLIGNSVCPQWAQALVKANVVQQGVLEDAAMSAGGAA